VQNFTTNLCILASIERVADAYASHAMLQASHRPITASFSDTHSDPAHFNCRRKVTGSCLVYSHESLLFQKPTPGLGAQPIQAAPKTQVIWPHFLAIGTLKPLAIISCCPLQSLILTQHSSPRYCYHPAFIVSMAGFTVSRFQLHTRQ
jgi:hypothetical protein